MMRQIKGGTLVTRDPKKISHNPSGGESTLTADKNGNLAANANGARDFRQTLLTHNLQEQVTHAEVAVRIEEDGTQLVMISGNIIHKEAAVPLEWLQEHLGFTTSGLADVFKGGKLAMDHRYEYVMPIEQAEDPVYGHCIIGDFSKAKAVLKDYYKKKAPAAQAAPATEGQE